MRLRRLKVRVLNTLRLPFLQPHLKQGGATVKQLSTTFKVKVDIPPRHEQTGASVAISVRPAGGKGGMEWEHHSNRSGGCFTFLLILVNYLFTAFPF
jgi:hypothetical protein